MTLLKQTPLKNKFYAFLKFSEEDICNGEFRYSSSAKEELVKITDSWVYELITREDCQLVFSDENEEYKYEIKKPAWLTMLAYKVSLIYLDRKKITKS